MTDYESPEITELGDIEAITDGRHFSSVDGNSGAAGNRGNGNGHGGRQP